MHKVYSTGLESKLNAPNLESYYLYLLIIENFQVWGWQFDHGNISMPWRLSSSDMFIRKLRYSARRGTYFCLWTTKFWSWHEAFMRLWQPSLFRVSAP